MFYGACSGVRLLSDYCTELPLIASICILPPKEARNSVLQDGLLEWGDRGFGPSIFLEKSFTPEWSQNVDISILHKDLRILFP
jgi:hypothetical protein